MRKKDLEKLELDIAREKDREVAERLKAVLEARQRERRERCEVGRRFTRGLTDRLMFLLGVFLLLLAVALGILAIANPPPHPGGWDGNLRCVAFLFILFEAVLVWGGVAAIRHARRPLGKRGG